MAAVQFMSGSAFHRIADLLQVFVFRQFRTENRFALFLGLLWRWVQTAGGLSRAKPSWRRYGKYGWGAVTALASSSALICSGVNAQPTAPRFCRNCSSLRAPMMTDDTVGHCKSRLMANVAQASEGLSTFSGRPRLAMRRGRVSLFLTCCRWPGTPHTRRRTPVIVQPCRG